MVDIANFIAQNFKSGGGNALALAADLKRAKSQNELLENQNTAFTNKQNRNNELYDALASGDVNNVAQYDPAAAGQLQGLQSSQHTEAAKRIAAFTGQVANSQNPKVLAATLMGSPEFTSAAESLGMDISQIGELDQYDDDAIRTTAEELFNAANAFAFGGANRDRVQSTQILDDNTIAMIVDGPGGQRIVRTDERARNPFSVVQTDAGVLGVDRTNPNNVQTIVSEEELTTAAADKKEAETEAAAGVVPAGKRSDAQAKFPRMKAASRRLEGVASAVEGLADNPFLKGGPGQSYPLSFTTEGQELEQSNAQLLAELTALTRIPGVGAQSDFEQRLQQLNLPDARFRPEVNKAAVEELNFFFQDLTEALEAVASGTAPEMNAEQPQQQQDSDPLGIR